MKRSVPPLQETSFMWISASNTLTFQYLFYQTITKGKESGSKGKWKEEERIRSTWRE